MLVFSRQLTHLKIETDYNIKHDNGVLEFIKKDNKYKDVILYFIGNKTHAGSSYYGKSTANFAILYNYEIISFYPIIPIIVFPLIVILITGLLYWKFQYEKKPKPQPQQKQETELRQELIEKQFTNKINNLLNFRNHILLLVIFMNF